MIISEHYSSFSKCFLWYHFQQIDLSLRFFIYVTLDSLLMVQNQPSSNSGAGTVIAFEVAWGINFMY